MVHQEKSGNPDGLHMTGLWRCCKLRRNYNSRISRSHSRLSNSLS
jgi:hypothetical protein